MLKFLFRNFLLGEFINKILVQIQFSSRKQSLTALVVVIFVPVGWDQHFPWGRAAVKQTRHTVTQADCWSHICLQVCSWAWHQQGPETGIVHNGNLPVQCRHTGKMSNVTTVTTRWMVQVPFPLQQRAS